MKTCVKKILFWVVCGVFVLTAIILFAVSSLDFLRDVWKWIIRLGGGNWWLGILILILAILGAINIFRGALKNAQADEVRLRLRKTWRMAIYLLVTLAGYGCLIIAFSKLST